MRYPGGNHFTLWTIRRASEWSSPGGAPLRTGESSVDEGFREAYAWMAARLAARVPPPAGVRWPLWAWRAWGGRNRHRPDLRASGHLPRGTRGVLLEIDVPEEAMLLSDFDRWHAVLNRHYLATSKSDDERFTRTLRRAGVAERWPYPEPFASRIIASWERIFAFDARTRSPHYWGPLDEAPIQAVLWEVQREAVRKAWFFTAR